MVKVVEDIFGQAVNPHTNIPEIVRRYTMTNASHTSVSVIQLGAIIQSIKVSDAYQNMADVCLGFDDIAGYNLSKHAYFGATLGRVANRVAKGEFSMNEQLYKVTKNFQDKYQLHGGFVGFDSVIWEVAKILPDGVTFRHVSPDGHEGYPGNITTMIHYTLDDDDRFFMRVEAITDKPTAINITNHAYFNLAGHDAGKKGLAEHRVMIVSNKIVDTDDEQIPTGTFLPVDDTVFDLRLPRLLGDLLKQFGKSTIKGYDNCFVVNEEADPNNVGLIAKVLHPTSGRFLEIHTNQPGVQFYTANNLPDEELGDDPLIGKGCSHYVKHGSFCLETEKFPDSVNHFEFPTVFLNPGERYYHEVIYKFGIQELWKCCTENE